MRILIASALCLAALPAIAAERRPIEPAARSCPGYGPGFIEVPGTSTCIRIGGRVSSEYGTALGRSARDSASGSRVAGRISMDSRTETGYGTVRTFVRLKAASDTGPGQPGLR